MICPQEVLKIKKETLFYFRQVPLYFGGRKLMAHRRATVRDRDICKLKHSSPITFDMHHNQCDQIKIAKCL